MKCNVICNNVNSICRYTPYVVQLIILKLYFLMTSMNIYDENLILISLVIECVDFIACGYVFYYTCTAETNIISS